ncbi:MAG TPA: hypothetical protein VKP68_03445 [Ramlibacter sp.]|nr:hypothetical protein [Ramlibacter sp.]
MKSRFEAITQRRTALIKEIGIARVGMALTVQSLRKELALASLGLMVSQLIGRRRWLRIASLVALAVSVGGPLLAHFFPARR